MATDRLRKVLDNSEDICSIYIESIKKSCQNQSGTDKYNLEINVSVFIFCIYQ